MSFTLFHSFAERKLLGQFNFAADTFKCAFSNTLPDVAAHQVLADITEIAAGNGYPAGGLTLDTVTVTRTAEVTRVFIDDEPFTPVGGPVGPIRYFVVYNDTPVDKPLVGFATRAPGSFTLQPGDPFILDMDAANGVLADTVVNA